MTLILSGQIIATSHDLTLVSGKSRLVKYYNLARYYIYIYMCHYLLQKNLCLIPVSKIGFSHREVVFFRTISIHTFLSF